MSDWYYEENSAPRGPIAEADLRMMIANGLLPPDVRIWTANFGAQWLPASQTQLRPQTTAVGTPPPLAVIGGEPPKFSGIGAAVNTTAAAYKPTYANLLALVLMIVMAMEIVALAIGVSPYDPAFQSGGTFWAFALAFIFAYKDASRIKAAGLNPQHRTMVPFLFLTQIGYFLRRKSVAGLSLTPLWLWVGSLVVYVIFYGAVYG